jgi:branched-chain amino acid transport system substrate-binding protein
MEMRSPRVVAAITCVAALALTSTVATATTGAGAGGGGGGGKRLFVIGAYEARGESAQAIPNFEDGAKLAVRDLEKRGWNVTYERIPASGVNAASQEAAFVAAEAENPDVWIGLTSSNVFIPVGPKIAATDVPVFALAAPTEGVRTGPSGGDNIFLLRPLNEQTYSQLLNYACKVMKLKRIGLNLVNTAFGTTVKEVVDREIPQYKNCEVVTEQTNAATATDLTQQALAFRDADVDGIISANFPGPMGVLVNQLRQNGVTVPFLGGASLNIAKDAGSLDSTENLISIDDCVPDIDADKKAKRFTRAYEREYDYLPNYASAQVYDAFFLAANAVEKAGHAHPAVVKALAGTEFDGVCNYATDRNNVLASSVTVYEYKPDGSKKHLKTYQLDFVPSDELASIPTTTTTVPAG